MKTKILTALLLMSIGWAAAQAQGPQAPSWPRVKTAADGTRITMYQPQVDNWGFYVKLDYRLAVEILAPGAAAAVPAALQMTAETNTDMVTRTVVVYNQKIVKASFPGADDATAQRLTALLTSIVPSGPMKISVDEILAYFTAKPAAAPGAASPAPSAPPPPARTISSPQAPPVILYSETPAILVIFDGEPKFASIQGTGLLFAVNTNWNVFQEEGKPTCYLLETDAWLQAPKSTGPWEPVTELPKSFQALPAGDNWADVTKNVPGKTISKEQMPKVFVSVQPAELILLDGLPELQAIPGTQLSYATNTDSDLFVCQADHHYYFLVSGRWFRAASLDGPWAFASDSLPADFARIPQDSPRADVRASVPGTPEAREAVVLAEAPHEAEVQRNSATVEVQYTGDPQFQPIDGTSLAYAVNTGNSVIQAGNSYYCCYQAVWFVAASPTGPWAVADTLPAAIYTIPPSCPVYNVTYVQVYDSTPTTVTTGYTAGYLGAFVLGACVVYGTGCYYPPYYYYPPGIHYPVYYPRPYSYGVAAAYNPYTGTYARGAVAYGPYGGCGYGAAYNPYTGTYARGAAAYGPYAGRGYAEAYNPYTGAWGQKAAAYGPGGQAGYAARGYNPSTGTGAATYQRSNPYASWGQSAVTKGDDWAQTAHYSDSRGTAAGFETSTGAKGAGVSTAYGNTAVAKSADNNMYAAHDGNVYKNDNGSWQKYNNGSWDTVQPPKPQGQPQAQAAAQSRSANAQAQWDQMERNGELHQAPTGPAAASGTRPAASSGWSQSSSELEHDRAARTESFNRQSNYNSWQSGGGQFNRGSWGGYHGGGGGGRRR